MDSFSITQGKLLILDERCETCRDLHRELLARTQNRFKSSFELHVLWHKNSDAWYLTDWVVPIYEVEMKGTAIDFTDGVPYVTFPLLIYFEQGTVGSVKHSDLLSEIVP